MSKLADDLYHFHKHQKAIGRKHGTDAGTVQHYKSLVELHEAVSPFQASYPLTDTERTEAHHQYLQEEGGSGEALRVAVLEDGTEVIHVLTEKASRAYGSPRWCTAYKNQKTYFEDYEDDLLVVIDPDGQRWQFHFRTNQFRDENDDAIQDLPSFLNDRNDLAIALVPYWEKIVIHRMNSPEAKIFSRPENLNPLGLAISVESFKAQTLQKNSFLSETLDHLDYSDEHHAEAVLLNVMTLVKGDPDFQDFMIPYIFDRGIEAFTTPLFCNDNDEPDEYFDAPIGPFEAFWEAVLSVPPWKKRALDEGKLTGALKTFLAVSNERRHRSFLDIAARHSGDLDIKDCLTSVIFPTAFASFHTKSGGKKISFSYEYMRFYHLLMSDPVWRVMALEAGINQEALPLLEETLASYDPETGIYCGSSIPLQSSYLNFCFLIKKVPEWEDFARTQGYLNKAITEGHLARQFDEYEQHARNNKFFGRTSRDYIRRFWGNILAVPEWADYALAENRLGRMLDIIFDDDLKPKRGLGFYARDEKNDPAKTFMFMMPVFYNRPGFRDAMTPYIGEALALSKEKDAFFKVKFSSKRKFLNVTTEILRYANRCSEWRDQVTAEHIEAALKDQTATAAVVTFTAGTQVSYHWKKAVLASSSVVCAYLSNLSADSTEQARKVIEGCPEYREAFGAYLS